MAEAREVFKRWFHDRYSDVDEIPDGDTEEWLSFSAELDAAGLTITPREPTTEMQLAGFNAPGGTAEETFVNIWRAMLSASQGGKTT